jgi:hypothetical protein
MKILYRISESTNSEHSAKRSWQVKLPNATKKKCLELIITHFPTSEIILFVDNITNETWNWLLTLQQESKLYWKHPIEIKKINAGSDAKSFRELLEYSVKLDDSEQVLFQEDDYLYLDGSEGAIKEALEFGDYVTGYLHPDKFIHPNFGGNPFVEQHGVSEPTRVIQTKSRFWTLTNSTTNTFATTAKILKEDYNEWMAGTSDLINTKDFETFLKLRDKGRTVLMPIPTLSTHGLRGFEAPLIGTGLTSWEKL